MAWATSNWNAWYVQAMGANTAKPTTDSFKVALYNNSVTTAQSTTQVLNEYNGAASPWVVANEVSSTNYTAGGVAVSSPTYTQTSNVVTFTSAGSPAWTTVSFSAYGDLVYDTTVANTALCWNYFGGVETVTAANFTITWSGSGIGTITC
jgi:hypothetical protein